MSTEKPMAAAAGEGEQVGSLGAMRGSHSYVPTYFHCYGQVIYNVLPGQVHRRRRGGRGRHGSRGNRHPGNGIRCTRCGRYGHGVAECWHGRCLRCHEPGHNKKQCLNDGGQQQQQAAASAQQQQVAASVQQRHTAVTGRGAASSRGRGAPVRQATAATRAMTTPSRNGMEPMEE